MAKVNIKSEKITPFGGILHVRELFSRFVGPVIDQDSWYLERDFRTRWKNFNGLPILRFVSQNI